MRVEVVVEVVVVVVVVSVYLLIYLSIQLENEATLRDPSMFEVDNVKNEEILLVFRNFPT